MFLIILLIHSVLNFILFLLIYLVLVFLHSVLLILVHMVIMWMSLSISAFSGILISCINGNSKKLLKFSKDFLKGLWYLFKWETPQIFLKTPWWQLKTLRRHSGSFVLKQILHGSKSLIYVPRKVTKLFSVFDFLSSGKTITCWEG